MTDKKQVRKFGCVAFIFFGVLFFLGVWRQKPVPTYLFGLLFLIGSGFILLPTALTPLYENWLKISHNNLAGLPIIKSEGRGRSISMKRIFYIVLAILIIAGVTSCNEESRPFNPNVIWGTGLKFDEETALKKLVAWDVLGYAISQSIDPVEFSYDVDLEEARAISISADYSSVDDRRLNETYVFADEENIESLTVTATGQSIDVYSRSGEDTIIRFSPLNIVFQFNDYVFTNSCGFVAYLSGKMECRVNGEYNRITEYFKGSASCTSGMVNTFDELIYVFQGEEERAVKMQVNININGNAFNLDSYRYSGMIFVDDRMMTVENDFNEEAICIPLQNR